MITQQQLDSLTEEELGYLTICCNTEWQQCGMTYPMKFNFIKSFKENAIHHILNKYSSVLKDEYKNTPIEIINKLEQNK